MRSRLFGFNSSSGVALGVRVHPGLQRSRCWTLSAAEDAGKIELGIGFRGISGPRDF